QKNLLFVAIASVSDHIETLFELDLEYGHVAKEVIRYKRVESHNDDPLFIHCLGELVKVHLDGSAKAHATAATALPDVCESFGSQKLGW
ncbi:hypothetical protein BC830DRAFT_1071769, partial [Chytriomyces sp. MP71]